VSVIGAAVYGEPRDGEHHCFLGLDRSPFVNEVGALIVGCQQYFLKAILEVDRSFDEMVSEAR